MGRREFMSKIGKEDGDREENIRINHKRRRRTRRMSLMRRRMYEKIEEEERDPSRK